MEFLHGRETGEVVSKKGLLGKMIDFVREKIFIMGSVSLFSGCGAAVVDGNGNTGEDAGFSEKDVYVLDFCGFDHFIY